MRYRIDRMTSDPDAGADTIPEVIEEPDVCSMNNRESYRSFCETEKSIPLFQQAFWLDAIAGEKWDVALAHRGSEMVGALPFTFLTRYGYLTYLTQPPLTQFLGPWIKPTSTKYAKRLGREKDVMQELIAQLPPYASFKQNWSHKNQNWIPFYWKGFQQTTLYTYVLEHLDDLDSIFKGFQENIRGDIRKAARRYKVVVRDDAPLGDFIRLNEQTFSRQGLAQPDNAERIERLVTILNGKKQVRWFVAYDPEHHAHAGVLIVWDEHSAYYLMGGGDSELRNSGATSLCMWEAIKFASTVTKSFDFEGSMIESVERFVRGFGAVQKPYFSISHTPSRLLRFIRALNS
jgi:hypothetical protein